MTQDSSKIGGLRYPFLVEKTIPNFSKPQGFAQY